uniref:Adhesion G protein-coupled receptor B N-terminal domain-containing protein n=1 Tax=Junco hyemalis TaxID=40217 RepID=A0A8C5JSU1_JUNHY
DQVRASRPGVPVSLAPRPRVFLTPGRSALGAAAGEPYFWCSTLVKGVIYGSYSVSEMFPKNFTNCTWTLENPDPTKYSIYLKFSKKDFSCSNFSLLAYQFDHFSHEKIKDLLKNNHSIMQLCNSKNAFVFLQYDKNFIQIRRVYPINFPGLHKKEEDHKSFFEFLVLNKVSPSQFGCHVLCTWLESCLKSENGRTESCGIMYTKCTCPQHLGEWGIDDQSLVLLNNVVLPLNEQTEGSAPSWGGGRGSAGTLEWAQWSTCSVTCGQGSQVRTRTCVSPYGTHCSGPLRESRVCNNTALCPGSAAPKPCAGPSCPAPSGRHAVPQVCQSHHSAWCCLQTC